MNALTLIGLDWIRHSNKSCCRAHHLRVSRWLHQQAPPDVPVKHAVHRCIFCSFVLSSSLVRQSLFFRPTLRKQEAARSNHALSLFSECLCPSSSARGKEGLPPFSQDFLNSPCLSLVRSFDFCFPTQSLMTTHSDGENYYRPVFEKKLLVHKGICQIACRKGCCVITNMSVLSTSTAVAMLHSSLLSRLVCSEGNDVRNHA